MSFKILVLLDLVTFEPGVFSNGASRISVRKFPINLGSKLFIYKNKNTYKWF